MAVIGDEIYTAKRVEFSGGAFYGYELGEPTKTMLCIMIKSVAGPFKDMVAMIPLVKIDSKILLHFSDTKIFCPGSFWSTRVKI